MKKLALMILLLVVALPGVAQDAGHFKQVPTNLLTFTSNNLSANEVAAFELRAIQKVEEFYNYLSVLSNKKYDIKMREQAKKQAADLFSDKSCTIYGVSIEKFLDSCFNGKMSPSVEISDKKTSSSFKETDLLKTSYTGTVSFATLPEKTKRTSVIQLQRREKQFGKEIKTIWAVFICEIK